MSVTARSPPEEDNEAVLIKQHKIASPPVADRNDSFWLVVGQPLAKESGKNKNSTVSSLPQSIS